VRDRYGEEVPGRPYVDTGPLLERDLAQRAGLGWWGKNTNLLHRHLGSYFFLGALLLGLDLAPDTPTTAHCGTCHRCLDACPTNAFPQPHVLDATRCISYLTIEHRGWIPEREREGIGQLAFGCDICQDVCPWNRRAPITAEAAFLARDLPRLVDLLTLGDDAYRARLRGSPLRRARRHGLARNAAIAVGNTDDPEAVPALGQALGDPAPEVRGHAAWALGRLGGEAARATLETARARETDASVKQAIGAALARLGERGKDDGDRSDT